MGGDPDIFDLFGVPEPVRNENDKPIPAVAPTERPVSPALAPRISDTQGSVGAGEISERQLELPALGRLGRAVGGLPSEFLKEPDLSMVAYAVADLLNAMGHPASLAAERWAMYEASGRRPSKIEEARARADAIYRADLDAIKDGWEPLFKTDQSSLPWRKTRLPGGPPPDEPGS